MTRHSDTVNSMPTVAVLRGATSRAVLDARRAWKRARDAPTEKNVKAAFVRCVLAVRLLRKAAKVSPEDGDRMLEMAQQTEVEADKLKARLVQFGLGADPG